MLGAKADQWRDEHQPRAALINERSAATILCSGRTVLRSLAGWPASSRKHCHVRGMCTWFTVQIGPARERSLEILGILETGRFRTQVRYD